MGMTKRASRHPGGVLIGLALLAVAACDSPQPVHPDFPQGTFVSPVMVTSSGLFAAMTLHLEGRRADVSWSVEEIPDYTVEVEVRSSRSFRWTRGIESFTASREGEGLRLFYTWGDVGNEVFLVRQEHGPGVSH